MSSHNPSRSDDPTRAMPRTAAGGGDVPPYGSTEGERTTYGSTDVTNSTSGMSGTTTHSPYTDTGHATGSSMGDDTSQGGMKDKAAETVSTAKDKATEMASTAKDKVSSMTGPAADKAKQAAGTATEKIDQQRDTVAGGLDTVATQLRDRAETLPGGEKTTQAAQTAAEKLQTASGYLREHEVSDMMTDVEQLVRSHPTQSLVVALAAGFLLGRALKG